MHQLFLNIVNNTMYFKVWENIAEHSASFTESFQTIHKSEPDKNGSWHKTGLINKIIIIGRESVLFLAATSRCGKSRLVLKNASHCSKKPRFL